jgi:hypothetical protein
MRRRPRVCRLFGERRLRSRRSHLRRRTLPRVRVERRLRCGRARLLAGRRQVSCELHERRTMRVGRNALLRGAHRCVRGLPHEHRLRRRRSLLRRDPKTLHRMRGEHGLSRRVAALCPGQMRRVHVERGLPRGGAPVRSRRARVPRRRVHGRYAVLGSHAEVQARRRQMRTVPGQRRVRRADARLREGQVRSMQRGPRLFRRTAEVP